MATVEAFEIEGLKLWFWSNDHEPPHFHAKRRGEWEVAVRFLVPAEEMIDVKWRKTAIPAKTIKNICKLAAEHRAALLAQWEAVQGS